MYNMNIAKVYFEMKRLASLGLARAREKTSGRKQYELADEDLRSLALKLSSRVQTLESWRSTDSRRDRFRMGLAAVPPFSLEGPPLAKALEGRRMPGELENLAALGRKKFDSKYRGRTGRSYDRV